MMTVVRSRNLQLRPVAHGRIVGAVEYLSGKGIWPDRDIPPVGPMLPRPAALCRRVPLAPTATDGKPRLSTLGRRNFPREQVARVAAEGIGFEPSVPRIGSSGFSASCTRSRPEERRYKFGSSSRRSPRMTLRDPSRHLPPNWA